METGRFLVVGVRHAQLDAVVSRNLDVSISVGDRSWVVLDALVPHYSVLVPRIFVVAEGRWATVVRRRV